MSVFHKINLDGLCDHKLIYDTPFVSQKECGLDGIYIDKGDVRISEYATTDGIDFRFVFGKFDNVVCNGQTVSVSARADKLHIIGFSYWGETCEFFRMVYDDGTEERINVPFMDWSHSVQEHAPWMLCDKENIQTVIRCISSGAATHIIYFHHIVVDLNGCTALQKIVMPNNFFIHVFAMTVEDTATK